MWEQFLTKDSVTVNVDGVVYFRVFDPICSVANVSKADHATQLLAQTTLRNVLGTKSLSELLSDRESISYSMQVHELSEQQYRSTITIQSPWTERAPQWGNEWKNEYINIQYFDSMTTSKANKVKAKIFFIKLSPLIYYMLVFCLFINLFILFFIFYICLLIYLLIYIIIFVFIYFPIITVIIQWQFTLTTLINFQRDKNMLNMSQK